MHKCPKCGRELASSGTISVSDGRELLTYECPDCVEVLTDHRTRLELPFTFAVDPAGRVFLGDGTELLP